MILKPYSSFDDFTSKWRKSRFLGISFYSNQQGGASNLVQPIYRWTMNESAGNSRVDVISGQDMTEENGSTNSIVGVLGDSADFSGNVTGYFKSPILPSLAEEWTMCGWYKQESVFRQLLLQVKGEGLEGGYFLLQTNVNESGDLYSEAANAQTYQNIGLRLDSSFFHLLFVKFQSGQFYLKKDTEAWVLNDAAPNNPPTTGEDFRIIVGAQQAGNEYPFRGKIDDLKYYNVALTDSEADAIFASANYSLAGEIPAEGLFVVTAHDGGSQSYYFSGNYNDDVSYRVQRQEWNFGTSQYDAWADLSVDRTGNAEYSDGIGSPKRLLRIKFSPSNRYLNYATGEEFDDGNPKVATPEPPTFNTFGDFLVRITMPTLPANADRFDVMRGGVFIGNAGGNADYDDTIVTADTNYNYTLIAIANEGYANSDPSSALSLTTPSEIPTVTDEFALVSNDENGVTVFVPDYLENYNAHNLYVDGALTNNDIGSNFNLNVNENFTLAADTTYAIKLRAITSNGSLYWSRFTNEISVKTLALPAQAGDFAAASNDGAGIFVTTPATFPDRANAFSVYRDGTLVKPGCVESEDVEATAAANTEYTFTVKGQNVYGASASANPNPLVITSVGVPAAADAPTFEGVSEPNFTVKVPASYPANGVSWDLYATINENPPTALQISNAQPNDTWGGIFAGGDTLVAMMKTSNVYGSSDGSIASQET